jgi:acyl carrier protein
MEIKNLIREALITELKENGFHKNIGDDESLIEAGIMDSLGILILLSILQDRFNITLNENDLNENMFMSINTITQFVEDKLAEQGQTFE